MKPTPKSNRTKPGKRVYRTPALRVHGDVRKLTAIKGGGSSDGSGKPKTKFWGSNS
jgi:hypothetical protein